MALKHALYFQLMSNAQAILILNALHNDPHEICLNNIYWVQAVQTAGEIYRQ